MLRRNHRILLGLLVLLGLPRPAAAEELPAWLPRYTLNVRVEVEQHQVLVGQRVTWTNRHPRPTKEVVFNAHAHYSIPDKDIGLLAKTVELLRMAPSETLSFAGPALEVTNVKVTWVTLTGPPTAQPRATRQEPLGFSYQADNPTALVVPLPHQLYHGETRDSWTWNSRCACRTRRAAGASGTA